MISLQTGHMPVFTHTCTTVCTELCHIAIVTEAHIADSPMESGSVSGTVGDVMVESLEDAQPRVPPVPEQSNGRSTTWLLSVAERTKSDRGPGSLIGAESVSLQTVNMPIVTETLFQ